MKFFEGAGKNENGNSPENKEGAKQESLVERKRQEAFAEVCDQLDERLSDDLKKSFESHGRHYELTSPEDCMVAFAQQIKGEIEGLHQEIISKNDYRQEQAAAKLMALAATYERLIALYAELRSYYPSAAKRVESHLPSLEKIAEDGKKRWDKIQSEK